MDKKIYISAEGESYVLHNEFDLRIVVEKHPATSDVRLPTKAYTGDAGFDLYTPCWKDKDIVLKPIKSGEIRMIEMGLRFKFNENWVMKIEDKSGIASKHGLVSIGGIIDSNYRNQIHVVVINHGKDDYIIEPDTKIAQAVFYRCSTKKDNQLYPYTTRLFAVSSDITERNQDGFGSTGIK